MADFMGSIAPAGAGNIRKFNTDKGLQNLVENNEIALSACDSVSISGGKSAVNIFPQDPLVSKPEQLLIETNKLGEKLDNGKIKVSDSNTSSPSAEPDQAGNMLYSPDDPRFDQVNAFVVSGRTLDIFESAIGHNINWKANSKLQIDPHAGVTDKPDRIAGFDDRNGKIIFRKFTTPEIDKEVNSAQSIEIVSHEVGHAILDGLRPGFGLSWDKETLAFHDSFADCASMLCGLSIDANIEAVAKETDGDLSKQNRIAVFSEEFGKAMRLKEDPQSTDESKNYRRSALNNFKYKDPVLLPQVMPDDYLSSSPHSFSKVFTGAFYDCLNNIYTKNLSGGDPANPAKNDNIMSSLEKSRDTLTPIFAKSVDFFPPSEISYKNAALSMLAADKLLNSGENSAGIEKAFTGRNILSRKDIEEFEKRNESLKSIKPEKVPGTKKEALKFLDKNSKVLGFNSLQLKDATITKDNQGNTFIQYSETHQLGSGSDSNPAVDVMTGFTLAFDKNGTPVALISDASIQNNVESKDAEITGITSTAVKNRVNKKNTRMSGLTLGLDTEENQNDQKLKDEVKLSSGCTAEFYRDPSSGKLKLRPVPGF